MFKIKSGSFYAGVFSKAVCQDPLEYFLNVPRTLFGLPYLETTELEKTRKFG